MEEGNACEKFKNDFQDEWEIFNFKFAKTFPSKIFSLTKDPSNESFFNDITDDTENSIITYIEHKNVNYKRQIDPLVSSQRTLRKWMRDIESDFAEKIIDQKIEELDRVINQQKSLIQQPSNASLSDDSKNQEEQVNKIPLTLTSPKKQKKKTKRKAKKPVKVEIVDEIVEIDDKGQEKIETTVTELEDGKVVSQKVYTENQELIDLEKEINRDEVESQ